jgi:hypothetical protein
LEFVGISSAGIESFQDNDLVALEPDGLVEEPAVNASEPEVAFASGDEEDRCLMDGIKVIEMQISTIDNVKGFWFASQLIEDVDGVNPAVCDNDEGRDTFVEVQKGLPFERAFVGRELGLQEKGEVQINGCGSKV